MILDNIFVVLCISLNPKNVAEEVILTPLSTFQGSTNSLLIILTQNITTLLPCQCFNQTDLDSTGRHHPFSHHQDYLELPYISVE